MRGPISKAVTAEPEDERKDLIVGGTSGQPEELKRERMQP